MFISSRAIFRQIASEAPMLTVPAAACAVPPEPSALAYRDVRIPFRERSGTYRLNSG